MTFDVKYEAELWFCRKLQLCVTNIVSCPGCPTDIHLFLPVLFLSSQTFSFLTTLSTFNHHRNVIFHICGVYVVFFLGGGGSASPSGIPSFMSLLLDPPPPLCPSPSSSSSFHSSYTIISPHFPNSQTCTCAKGKKNKTGRALIPGIWESPCWPEQTEPRSLWFGQCYSCLSK